MNGRKKSVSINRAEELQNTRRCDKTRWEMLMTRSHHWLAGPMREMGTEMNEQNDGKARDMAAWEGN